MKCVLAALCSFFIITLSGCNKSTTLQNSPKAEISSQPITPARPAASQRPAPQTTHKDIASSPNLPPHSPQHTATKASQPTSTKGLFFHNSTWPIVVSPDGKTIATVGQTVDSVLLYDVASRKTKLLHTTNVTDFYNVRMCTRSLVFTPDSKTLYVGGARLNDGFVTKGTLNQWDVATGKHLKTFAKEKTRGPVVLLSPDGKVLATGGIDDTIRFWNPQTGKEVGVLPGPGNPEGMAYSPDGKLLATGGIGSYNSSPGHPAPAFRVWNLRTKKVVWQAALPSSPFDGTSLAWSPDGKYIAMGTQNNRVAIWETATHHLRYMLRYPPPDAADIMYAGTSSEVHFSPDSQQLASGGYEGVNLWNLRTGKLVHHYKGCNGLAFWPDGSKLLMGGGFKINRVLSEKL